MNGPMRFIVELKNEKERNEREDTVFTGIRLQISSVRVGSIFFRQSLVIEESLTECTVCLKRNVT